MQAIALSFGGRILNHGSLKYSECSMKKLQRKAKNDL